MGLLLLAAVMYFAGSKLQDGTYWAAPVSGVHNGYASNWKETLGGFLIFSAVGLAICGVAGVAAT